ncbi:monovalent cation/H(+) antiporter subunit G [Halapricum desulfuricans]|uniref:Multisubunit Na+/H+ antiporter, MnhG subunit n=1 Tax=Halapricum desulfuricans TaxID=2841257 RepID=A0A897MVA9_9EURY|nr:monovalent cation/H(+) antiporter subunit G [Halapricum desulfuricans]QSG04417.1 Multisubunit Na+/H+ antiporter, MnhG subunit [Halapricum desulfuricans]
MVAPATAVAAALVAGGLAFTVVALVGLVRLPDLYSRAHATSKSETLGALLALAGAAAVFGAGQPTLKLGLLAVFVLVTSPTATHAIVRSAHEQGIEPWTRGDGE